LGGCLLKLSIFKVFAGGGGVGECWGGPWDLGGGGG